MTNVYRIPNVNNQKPQLADLGFYCDVRFDADDSAPTYIGLHLTNGAATTDTNWKVLKLSYSGANVTRVQTAYGTWDGRSGLF